MVGMTFFIVYGNNLIFGLVYCKKNDICQLQYLLQNYKK